MTADTPAKPAMGQRFLTLGLCAAAGIAVLGTIAYFAQHSRSLTVKLSQSELVIQKTQEEITRLRADKEQIAGENEKLQADAISYLGLNTSMQGEQRELEQRVAELKKTLEQKEEQFQKAQLGLERLQKKVAKERRSSSGSAHTELAEGRKAVKTLQETLAKERGLYHYNLAVAYTQAKLYDEAIGAYAEAIRISPDNAEAYYNLGLLYGNIKPIPEKAVANYREYLRLTPDAEDKDEVLEWIRQLEGPPRAE